MQNLARPSVSGTAGYPTTTEAIPRLSNSRDVALQNDNNNNSIMLKYIDIANLSKFTCIWQPLGA